MDDRFGVTAGFELMPVSFQPFPQFQVVVDLSVEDQLDRFVFVGDRLLSACDIERYRLLGHEGYHRNCADNLRECAATLGIELADIPSPFNVFEHVRIDDQGGLSIQTPVAKAGDALTLRTETDLHLVFSACPMDIALTNGPDGRAKPVRVEFTASST